jgi:alpha-beta hydrolase superfamily lysophospholipase
VNHRTSSLRGAGGRRIFTQSWLPDEPPRALVVIVHGAGEHSDRYRHVAAALVEDGYGVHALDHRGHGRSDGPRALIDRLDHAVTDVDQLVLEAREPHPGVPVFMLAHSMGGTIGLRYAVRHPDRLSGLILSGPLAELAAAPAPLRIAARVLSAMAPRLPLIAVDSAQVSRDPEVVSAYRSDPLVHHGKLPVRTVAELAKAIDAFPEDVRAITVPTLIIYGTEDALCPPSGSVMLGERIGAEDKTVTPYEGLFHEILNEPERELVLADIRSWLAARVPAPAARGAAASSTS